MPLAAEGMLTLAELRQRRMENNSTVLERLTPDQHAEALFEACVSDARLGRMTEPMALRLEDLDRLHFSPRFPVLKGGRTDIWFCASLHLLSGQARRVLVHRESDPSTI